jgi:DNA-binding MarR family transcriptional regulator
MSERLSDLELDAWQALLHAHQRIVDALDAELRAEHDITFGDYDVLLRLARAPDRRLRMSELAKRVMISPSGLTRAVDRMVSAGYVIRERDDADARVVHAQLTEAGRDRVKRAARTHLRGVRAHFTGQLTEEQLRHVAGALQVITGPHEPH